MICWGLFFSCRLIALVTNKTRVGLIKIHYKLVTIISTHSLRMWLIVLNHFWTTTEVYERCREEHAV